MLYMHTYVHILYVQYMHTYIHIIVCVCYMRVLIYEVYGGGLGGCEIRMGGREGWVGVRYVWGGGEGWVGVRYVRMGEGRVGWV